MYQIANRCLTQMSEQCNGVGGSISQWLSVQTWASDKPGFLFDSATQLSVLDQWPYLVEPFCQLGNEIIPVAPQAGRSEDGEGKALPTVCRQVGHLIGISSSTVRAAKAEGKQPFLPGLCPPIPSPLHQC